MANTFYDITETKIVGIKNALLAKYGAYNASTNPTGVEIYYQTASSVIFKCSRFSDKVIRIFSASRIYGEYGDSWVSGDAVTNPKSFGGNSHSSPNTYHLLLCENSIVLSCYSTTTTTSSKVLMVGKLSNDQSIAFACQSDPSYSTGTRGLIIDTGEDFYPVVPKGNLLSNAGEIFKMKFYISKKTGGSSVYNLDGTPAYAKDIEVAFYEAGITTSINGANYYLTPSGLYMEGASVLRVPNSFLIDLN